MGGACLTGLVVAPKGQICSRRSVVVVAIAAGVSAPGEEGGREVGGVRGRSLSAGRTGAIVLLLLLLCSSAATAAATATAASTAATATSISATTAAAAYVLILVVSARLVRMYRS